MANCPFKVGDEVIILASARNYYSITTPGSTGKVLAMSPNECKVKFDYLSSEVDLDYLSLEYKRIATIYWIDNNHLGFKEKGINYSPTKEDQIISKIKQLDTKWKNRKREKNE